MLEKLTIAHQAILDVPTEHKVGSPAFNLFMKSRKVDVSVCTERTSVMVDCGFKLIIKMPDECTLDYSQVTTPTDKEAVAINHLAVSISAKLKAHGEFHANT